MRSFEILCMANKIIIKPMKNLMKEEGKVTKEITPRIVPKLPAPTKGRYLLIDVRDIPTYRERSNMSNKFGIARKIIDGFIPIKTPRDGTARSAKSKPIAPSKIEERKIMSVVFHSIVSMFFSYNR